jgi:ribosome-associated protein
MAKKAASNKPAVAPAPAPLKFEEEVMARAAAEYADNKKAEDIVILDVRGISPVTDYLVICTVASMPQLKAVRDEIWSQFWEKHHLKPIATDMRLESLWIILHYGDVMVHIFHADKRDFYALEDLWNDAKRVAWAPAPPPAVVKTKAAPVVKKAAKVAVKKTAKKTVKKAAKKAAK